ncbi:MAG: hypothetical protein PVF58_14455 [Candidatus Methanofastidiosia archaeon]
MGNMGEINIWFRDEHCSVLETAGKVFLRPCCIEKVRITEFSGGHCQIGKVPPGCYVVRGDTEHGPLPPMMVIVKCAETVCLNPILEG